MDGAMTGENYDLMLRCTIGHLRRIDGALPDFADGAKALNLIAPPGEPRHAYFAYLAYFAYIYLLIFRAYRHVLRSSQPVYGFWYYFMIHRGIGLSLQKILPKFIPRNDEEVDALLNCKLRVYVLHI